MNEKIKALFRKEWTLSQSNKVKEIIKSFSIGEKVAFYALVTIFVISSLSLLWQVNQNFLVEVPAHGGTLTEGVVGNPRFVDPLLALSDADRDLTALIYSGLLKEDAKGTLIPDLAESYKVSSDGLNYTFILKDNAMFQDGTKVTADDVVFTVTRAQDAALKSPQGPEWSGIVVQKIDDKTIQFTLKQPYAPFIYNTTLGILPKHIWKDVSDDSFPFSALNIRPIGSGPYSVSKIKTDNSGLPIEYDLKANAKYISGEPYISTIILKFYQNENDIIDAYNNGDVDAINSITPQNMSLIKRTEGVTQQATLSRVFGIFFNQNQNPVLVNKEVRQALDASLDKQQIVTNVLLGFGTPLDGPVPTDTDISIATTSAGRITAARKILEKAGWTLGTDGIYVKKDPKNSKNTQVLSLSISTSDAPELKALAELIQQQWIALGAKVDVKIFEIGDLNQNIIRPRKYDALLFGEVISPGEDLYPFWHSSQRNDPGLNVAMYTNIKADATLEDLRKETDITKQAALEQSFESQIASDVPTVFLYSPDFIYIVPQTVKNLQLDILTTASDRFNTVTSWYINTSNVWQIFANNK